MDKFKYIGCSILNLACLLIPIAGIAAEWPELSSRVPGVYILSLEATDTDDHPSAYIRDSEHELIKHCATEKTIYVLGAPGGAQCLLKVDQGVNEISVFSPKHKMAHGLVTVSTKKFPSQTFNREPLSVLDKKLIESMLSSRRAQLHKEEDAELKEAIAKGWTTQENHRTWMSQLMNSAELKRKRSPGVKIQTKNAIYVVEEVGVRTNAIGWDFLFAVFDTTKQSPEFLGEFKGCINDFADIDGDGIPEVRTSLCDSTEGTIESYWSLTGFEQVVTWEAS